MTVMEDELRNSSSAPKQDLDSAEYHQRIADLVSKVRRLSPATAPFRAAAAYRSETMVFNISDYGHTLLNDFFIAGGQFKHANFHAPSQIAALGRAR
jgi:hypothetical protein